MYKKDRSLLMNTIDTLTLIKKQYKNLFFTYILEGIPLVLLEELPDKAEFIQRLLMNAQINGDFKKIFKRTNPSAPLSKKELHQMVYRLLVSVKKLTLKPPQSVTYMEITPEGEFKPFQQELPQVAIDWSEHNHTLYCHIYWTDGSIETLGIKK